MSGFGNFAKNEKKKKKKNKMSASQTISTAPVFRAPTVVPRKRNEQ